MIPSLKNKSFLTLVDFEPDEIMHLIELATDLKSAKRAGIEKQHLKGKEIALIFEKDSTRTRVGFEVAAYDQGAHVTYLGPSGTQIGHKETMKDTARVLGRIYDAIEYRGFAQASINDLAKYAGVPVYNGLTDEFHPTQVLADLLTMREHGQKRFDQTSICFMGDAGNNMGDSLLIGCAKMGMDIRLCAPKECWPIATVVDEAKKISVHTRARTMITEDVAKAIRGCDFIYTDVWLSMGQPAEKWAERIKLLVPYQVNSDVMTGTGNPNAKFMHCLPAFHNAETKVGKEIKEQFGLDAMEVTEEVFEFARIHCVRTSRKPHAHNKGSTRGNYWRLIR